MSATLALLKLDLRGIVRDNVLMMNVFLSFAVMLTITILGLFKADSDWAEWFPFMVVMSLLSGPPAYGFLFGVLMVDERDTGVRSVLAVSPLRPARMLFIRTAMVMGYMVFWPLVSVLIMNTTWNALPVSVADLLAVIAMLSIGAPLTAIAVATFAQNMVEAMALFKGINFTVIAPLALYFLPETGLRFLFLILPSAWGVFAFDAFAAGDRQQGYLWLAGGSAILLTLLALTMRHYIATQYREIG